MADKARSWPRDPQQPSLTGAGAGNHEPVAERADRLTDLRAIQEALAEFTDTELRALIVAINEVPRTAPGLFAWIEGTCVWEVNRRRGFDYRLQPLHAAIDQSQEVVCIKATFEMQASFATGEMAPAALTFFDALMDLLTGVERKH